MKGEINYSEGSCSFEEHAVAPVVRENETQSGVQRY